MVVVLTLIQISCGKFTEEKKPKQPIVESNEGQDFPAPYVVTNEERTQHVAEMLELKKKLLALEYKMLEPAKEDFTQNAEFLKGANSGIGRVFPAHWNRRLGGLALVNAGGTCFNIKEKSNVSIHGFDFCYSYYQDKPRFEADLSVGSIGFIGALGKIDLSQITDASHPAISFALSYEPPKGPTYQSWQEERKKWFSGVQVGGVWLGSEISAVVGTAYVARSIAENRSDRVFLFQFIRRDTLDNSVIFVWKLMKEFEKPKMEQAGTQ